MNAAISRSSRMSPFSGRAIGYIASRAMHDLVMSFSILAIASLMFLVISRVVLGRGPAELWEALFSPVAGSHPIQSFQQWSVLVNSAAPLWLAAMAFSVPYHAGFINLGGEGQISIGGFAAAAAAICAPSFLLTSNHGQFAIVGLSVLAAALSAGLWGLAAFLLKAKFGANEVIVTLLLNTIALGVINLALKYPVWADTNAQGVQTRSLPGLLSKAHASFLAAHGFTLLCFVLLLSSHAYLWWSKPGLRLRAAGRAPAAAQLCGINPRQMLFVAVLVGTCLAGISAVDQVFSTGRFYVDHFVGWGFEGITIAILGRHRMVGIIVTSIYFAFLKEVGISLQIWGSTYGAFIMVQALFLFVYLFIERRTRI